MGRVYEEWRVWLSGLCPLYSRHDQYAVQHNRHPPDQSFFYNRRSRPIQWQGEADVIIESTVTTRSRVPLESSIVRACVAFLIAWSLMTTAHASIQQRGII